MNTAHITLDKIRFRLNAIQIDKSITDPNRTADYWAHFNIYSVNDMRLWINIYGTDSDNGLKLQISIKENIDVNSKSVG
jgi:hypothetical protein